MPVAQSVPSDDEFAYLRQYPQALLYAHATGFYSFFFGRSAVERSQNEILSGNDDRLFVRRLVDLVTGREPQGGTVKLTLDPAAQAAAYEALGDNKGAVVALNPSTGAILAMVSKPSFDPNPLASHSIAEQQEAWDALMADPDKPDRQPGHRPDAAAGFRSRSSTAAAALESGRYEPDSEVPGPASYDLPQSDRELPNQSGEPCGSVPSSSRRSRTRCGSRATPRSPTLGNELGDDALREQAERFGFNSEPLTDERPQRRDQRLPGRAGPRRRPRSPPSASSTSGPRRCRSRWSRRPSQTAAC